MIRTVRRGGVWLVSIAFFLAACAKEPPPPARPKAPPRGVVIVSGHEPFAGLEKNTSWEVAKTLDGETIGGLEVVAVRLPVVWEECAKGIREAIRIHRPRAVLGTGVAWKGLVQVETLARNERRAYRDNDRALPRSARIDPDGPATIPTRMPVAHILKRLKALGVPHGTSDDAGGYLCNETFYSLLQECARLEKELGRPIPAGFIHLPRAVEHRQGRPTRDEQKVRAITLDEVVEAVRAALEETVAARKQIR